MLGDLINSIKQAWKRFKCIHDYKPDRIGFITGWPGNRICSKCGRRER